jgi:hypothetical protein
MIPLRSVVVSILWLLPILALAQVRSEFVGTWVIDVEKMAQVDPGWNPPPAYEDRFIVTGFQSGRLLIQGSSIWLPGSFDPSGEATKIALSNSELMAVCHWEEDRFVIRLEEVGRRRVVTRAVFRERHWLVIEDVDQAQGRTVRTYFVKS